MEIKCHTCWVLNEKRNKTKAFKIYNNRQNLSEFEKHNMYKVYGKLQLLDQIETKIKKLQKANGQTKL